MESTKCDPNLAYGANDDVLDPSSDLAPTPDSSPYSHPFSLPAATPVIAR